MGYTIKYISPETLKDIIKSKKAQEDYAVVDVRDHDFLGGNIPNCLHVPSQKFETRVSDLVDKLRNVPTVVFHCFLSQERGPKSARIYHERREEKLGTAADSDPESSASDPPHQEVLVLRGGFTVFQAAYKDDPELVEKWRKEVWANY